MFQRRFKGVLTIFRGCLEGVLRMFQSDLMGVSSFKDVLKVIKICFRCFQPISPKGKLVQYIEMSWKKKKKKKCCHPKQPNFGAL